MRGSQKRAGGQIAVFGMVTDVGQARQHRHRLGRVAISERSIA